MNLRFFPPATRRVITIESKIRRSARIALSIGLAVLIFLPPLTLTVSAHAPAAPEKSQPENYDVDSFIIELTNGHTGCREARPDEVLSTLRRPEDIGVPVKQLLFDKAHNLVAQGENASTGLTINLVALSQLQTDPNMATVVAAFQRAAAVWTDRIKSPVTISIDIDYGVNMPNGDPFKTGVLGTTSSRRTQIDYPGARTNLLAGSSGAAETAIYNLLPTSYVPTDVGNGGVVSVNRSVAFALGIPVTSPFDQNVATMAFNKNFAFDFNPDDGITSGETDFVAVAAHEIGHALGFTSNASQLTTAPVTLWDIFRFRPGTTTGTFTTAERILSIGGEQVYFTGESFVVAGIATNELRLSTGGPDPKSGDGDGRQSSHWKDDSLNSGRFIGIMDPTIASGVREDATPNDFAALETFGWNLINSVAPPPAPPPPPPPANDNFANAQVLTGCSGTVAGSNVGATRETGEPNHSPDGGGGSRSVWYQWQSPSSGAVTITTAGSRFDTVLAIYTGSSVSSLSQVGSKSDDISDTDKTSSVTFTAVAGTTYRIAVDGYNNSGSGGDFGPSTLNWTATNCSTSPPIQLLLEQSGPAADQAAALDSILFLRDPFLVVNSANVFFTGSDRNTRLLIFVADLQLQPGAPPSSVTINLVDSNNQTYNVVAEDFRAVPNQTLTQITFRLPDGLPAGTCKIKVVTQTQVSNTATIRIAPAS